MKKMKNNGAWYGEIQSSRGNIIVITDDSLAIANKGRLYLYNTQRDAIIEYDETIVSPKLVELSDDDAADVKIQFTSAWEVARKEFTRSHTKVSTAAEIKAESTKELAEVSDDDPLDDDD